jgi:predicted transcriptional regulator of viral defense system
MDKLVKFFKQNKGYARSKDLVAAGIYTRNIAKALADDVISKIKPGLYKLSNYDVRENSGLVDVCNANPSIVICLISALEYYGMTLQNPSVIYAAIPNSGRKITLSYPPVNFFYFSKRLHELGIIKAAAAGGAIRVYELEKTICDLFRFRKKIGEDIAIEGLKNYIRKNKYDIGKLLDYAAKCRVKNIITPYLKALVEQ